MVSTDDPTEYERGWADARRVLADSFTAIAEQHGEIARGYRRLSRFWFANSVAWLLWTAFSLWQVFR